MTCMAQTRSSLSSASAGKSLIRFCWMWMPSLGHFCRRCWKDVWFQRAEARRALSQNSLLPPNQQQLMHSQVWMACRLKAQTPGCCSFRESTSWPGVLSWATAIMNSVEPPILLKNRPSLYLAHSHRVAGQLGGSSLRSKSGGWRNTSGLPRLSKGLGFRSSCGSELLSSDNSSPE